MVCLYAVLLSISHPSFYFFQLRDLQPVSLPFCYLTKYASSKLYFARPHKPVLTFNRDRRTRGPQHFSAALHCGLQNWRVRHNLFIKIDTKPRLHLWSLGIFCGRNKLIPFFCLWCNFVFWSSFRELEQRCRRSHRAAAAWIGAGAAAASLLSQDPVYPPPTTPVFDLLTAADGKDMSLEL